MAHAPRVKSIFKGVPGKRRRGKRAHGSCLSACRAFGRWAPASSIAVASLVDPTKQDLIVANINSNDIPVLLGNG